LPEKKKLNLEVIQDPEQTGNIIVKRIELTEIHTENIYGLISTETILGVDEYGRPEYGTLIFIPMLTMEEILVEDGC